MASLADQIRVGLSPSRTSGSHNAIHTRRAGGQLHVRDGASVEIAVRCDQKKRQLRDAVLGFGILLHFSRESNRNRSLWLQRGRRDSRKEEGPNRVSLLRVVT